MKKEAKPQRTIRSFVNREGRLTKGQERILKESAYLISTADLKNTADLKLLPQSSVNAWDLDTLFGRKNNQRTLEIGFGNGSSLVKMAEMNPERDFLGVEVHKPGVGHLLLAVEEKNLTNLRVVMWDAITLVERFLLPHSFDAIQIFFPDPWHKKRHYKRRLIQRDFIEKLLPLLKPEGKIYMATDWEDYASQMLAVLQSFPELVNCYKDYAPERSHRPQTKFELRGLRLGHVVKDLVFKRISVES